LIGINAGRWPACKLAVRSDSAMRVLATIVLIKDIMSSPAITISPAATVGDPHPRLRHSGTPARRWQH
jgi:hypothetical protein